MSWEQVKYLEEKMNVKIDQIKTIEDIPLNHYFWLQDYKTNKENSYVFMNKEIYHEAMTSFLFMIDPISGPDSITYMSENSDGFGATLRERFSLANGVDWDTLKTMELVVSDNSAMTIILQNAIARKVLFMNAKFINSFKAIENWNNVVVDAFDENDIITFETTSSGNPYATRHISYSKLSFIVSYRVTTVNSNPSDSQHGWNIRGWVYLF